MAPFLGGGGSLVNFLAYQLQSNNQKALRVRGELYDTFYISTTTTMVVDHYSG